MAAQLWPACGGLASQASHRCHLAGRPPQATELSRCAALRARAAVLEKRAGADAVRTIPVDLGDRTYPIYIGEDLLAEDSLLAHHVRGQKVLIVSNETVAPLYLERCREALLRGRPGLQVAQVILPDGESHKTMEVVSQVWDAALGARLDRGTCFVALGGGVVGDMAGFAAAAYQRGVDFIQVPTTVMAMVDSSVGGKTGVNHPLGKNMIGAFHQPRAVVADVATLRTLPRRELASGLSEVVKYGLIRDAPLFAWLEQNMEALLACDREAMAYAIERSCVNKAEVVAADEREGGVRATLNLGHTFGHAIETWSGYGEYLHGEAVAIGMVMAADLSRRLDWIEDSIVQRTKRLLECAQLPVAPPQGMTPGDFLEIMAVDKKVLDGRLRLILLRGPLGGCVVTGEFNPAALRATLDAFCLPASPR